MPRGKTETPQTILQDKAYFPMRCDGNGNPQSRSYAPSCPVHLTAGDQVFFARWKSSPHETVHCRACRDHFFAPQRKLEL